jgi:hypothetical protein
MPLVIPGMQSSGGDDKTSKWMDQLMGKKLGDSSDNMVCVGFYYGFERLSLTCGTDIRKEGPASTAPRRQGRLDDDHGPQPRSVREWRTDDGKQGPD